MIKEKCEEQSRGEVNQNAGYPGRRKTGFAKQKE